jgi:hypothetical protein
VSDREDAGWSRAEQDQAEAKFYPGGRPQPETHDYVAVRWRLVLLGAIIGAVIGGIVGWADYRPDPTSYVDSRPLGVVEGAFVGFWIGAFVSLVVFALVWPPLRRFLRFLRRVAT